MTILVITGEEKRGERKESAIKIDVTKAYDKVEWDFLEKTTMRMGFGER